MNKKAQVTLFVIVGILIVVFAMIYFLVLGNSSKELNLSDISSINSFVRSCIETTGNEVIFEVAKGGGYYFPPELSISSGIPIYFVNGTSYVPSKKEIEDEISFFVKESLFFCTRNFINFPEFNIVQEEINVETIIEEESVTLKVNYPLRIEQGNKVILINDFEETIDSRLGVIYDAVVEFISGQKDYEGICLNCLLELSFRRDFYVSMIDYDDETTIFLIKDRDSIYDEDYLIYAFANKYGVLENEK